MSTVASKAPLAVSLFVSSPRWNLLFEEQYEQTKLFGTLNLFGLMAELEDAWDEDEEDEDDDWDEDEDEDDDDWDWCDEDDDWGWDEDEDEDE